MLIGALVHETAMRYVIGQTSRRTVSIASKRVRDTWQCIVGLKPKRSVATSLDTESVETNDVESITSVLKSAITS